MARPKLKHLTNKLITIGGAAEILELSERKITRRIECGLLPTPTITDRNGVRYFNRTWVMNASAALARQDRFNESLKGETLELATKNSPLDSDYNPARESVRVA